MPSPAFSLPPPSALRRARAARSRPAPPCLRNSAFVSPRRPARRPLRFALVRYVTAAVQASPLSGDSNGNLRETTAAPKSYSVGVTVVSGCDTGLRRNVIEKIAAASSAGRVVVVTTGGLASTTNEVEGTAGREGDGEAEREREDGRSTVNGYAVPAGDSLGGAHASQAAAVQNLEGWISCSSPEEMAEVVVKLAASRECDYIVAEGSTGCNNSIEPQELAGLLQSRAGASLRVDSLVSVLDGDTLLQDLSAQAEPVATEDEGESESSVTHSDAPEAMQDTADTRPMVVISLVENANVIVVSRNADGTQSDSMNKVQNLLSVLNGTASILAATNDVVPVDQLVNTNAYDHESVMLGATWKKVLIASRNGAKGNLRPALPKAVKEATFVYRARRPFHPTRLYQHIKAVATFDGVIRSTGRIWLATRMLAPLEWNQAGVAATLSVGKLFWAATPEAEWPTEDEERSRIMANWDTQYGDRETEIVFVGIGIDKERLQGLLDGCLLQDEEMVFTNLWENFEDPFVEWVPLIEDDDEDALADPLVEEEEPVSEAQASTSSPAEEVAKIAYTEMPSLGREASEQSESDGVRKDGIVQDFEVSQEAYERLSALDIFDKGLSGDTADESGLVAQPLDDGEFDKDNVVIASWDSVVADGILTQMPEKGLPVTIVTGFLGSGKTTLLNHILTAEHGLKIAVLVNEFGEIDIDNQLVEKGDWSSDDEVMELANGCICCSINDSFVTAVAKILERKDQVDYLIVETTGVADPVPVINSLMVSDIAEDVRVDGILTLVDAENFDPETNMDSEAALSQVMAADTILLSKTDVAPAGKVDKTIEYIKSVRPAARILRSQRGRVPLSMILDVGVRLADSPAHLNPVGKAGRRRDTGTSPTSRSKSDGECDPDGSDKSHDHGEPCEHQAHAGSGSVGHSREHDHEGHHDHECGPACTDESHSHNHDHSGHLEADGFVTTSFKSDVPLDAQLFMDKFLQRLPEGVFRAKGLLRFYGYGGRYVFQLSGRRYQFEEDEWPEDAAPGNQLVIIGKNLDLDSLRSTLEECLVEEKA